MNTEQCLCNDYNTERISFRCKFQYENRSVSKLSIARTLMVATGQQFKVLTRYSQLFFFKLESVVNSLVPFSISPDKQRENIVYTATTPSLPQTFKLTCSQTFQPTHFALMASPQSQTRRIQEQSPSLLLEFHYKPQNLSKYNFICPKEQSQTAVLLLYAFLRRDRHTEGRQTKSKRIHLLH